MCMRGGGVISTVTILVSFITSFLPHITLATFMTFLILYLIPPTSNMMFPNKTEGNPRCAEYICRVLASASRPSINRDKLWENLGLYVCCFLGCC